MQRPTELGCKWLKELAAFQFRFAWAPYTEDEAADILPPPPVEGLGESNCMDGARPQEEGPDETAWAREDVRGFLSMGDIDLAQVRNAQQEDPELVLLATWMHGRRLSQEDVRARSTDLQKYITLLPNLYID